MASIDQENQTFCIMGVTSKAYLFISSRVFLV